VPAWRRGFPSFFDIDSMRRNRHGLLSALRRGTGTPFPPFLGAVTVQCPNLSKGGRSAHLWRLASMRLPAGRNSADRQNVQPERLQQLYGGFVAPLSLRMVGVVILARNRTSIPVEASSALF